MSAPFVAIRQRLNFPAEETVHRLRHRLFPWRVRHVHGPRRVHAGADELVVVCLVRDGAAYLDAFLEHYRVLGARHMVLLDNGSTDGTIERAAREPGVTVFRTGAAYRAHKVIAKRYLVRRFGPANWVLCADIDELFDYPQRTRMPLRRFLRYLNAHGYTAVVAHLLDMFPRGPLTGGPGHWRQTHCYYDLTGIETEEYRAKYGDQNDVADERIRVLHGGVRALHFGVRPMLTKHPLQFPAAGVEWVNSHNVRRANVADVSAVLLHFKFVSGFVDYAKRLVRERSFYRDSAEYRGYLDALEAQPQLSLYSGAAREFVGTDHLVAEGLLHVSDRFRAWADG
jgi:hypothetical protein